MTQVATDVRNIVARSGYANPITLDLQSDDEDYIQVYADDELLVRGADYVIDSLDPISVTILGADDIDNYVGYENFTLAYNPAMEQAADFSSGGVQGRGFEAALDAQNRKLQAVADRVDRALLLPPYVRGPVTTDTPLDGQVPVWNEAAQHFTWAQTPEQSAESAEAAAASAAEAAASENAAADSEAAASAALAAIEALTSGVSAFWLSVVAATSAAASWLLLQVLGHLTTRTAIKALVPSGGMAVFLSEAGREGTFVWRTGDYSALVTADTAEGLYLKADTIASTVGAWVRDHDGVVALRWFGPAKDGVTDDAAKLRSFLNLLSSIGAHGVAEPGTYATESTIEITGVDYSVNMTGARIQPASSVLIGVQLGTTASILGNVRIDGLCVDRVSYDGATENIGIKLRNVANSTFVDMFSRESKYNFKLAPQDDDRVGYNTFINARAFNGYYNIWYLPTGDGWANENHWFGGRYQCSANTVHNVHIDGEISSNENKFISMSLEGGGATQAAIYCDGHANVFEYPRLEGTWASGAAVILGTLSVRNYISSQRFDEDVIDRGTGNVIDCAAIRKTNISVNGRNTQRFLRTAGSAQSAFSSAPTATTTANSATITVSSSSELAVGQIISIPGSVTQARIEYINGTSVLLDRPCAPAVSGVTVLREMSGVVDISDAGSASGDSFVLALNAGRSGNTTKLIEANARGTKRFGVDGNGSIYSAVSAWNAPFRLGDYYLWVDTSDRLRIKNGAPSGPTDGTIVGLQS